MSDWIDEVRSGLVGLGEPWTAERDGSAHRGVVRDASGEAIAMTYCTGTGLVHGGEMARRIAVMPADLRRLLDVAEAARDAVRIADVISAAKRAGGEIEAHHVERANAIVDRLRAALRGGP